MFDKVLGMVNMYRSEKEGSKRHQVDLEEPNQEGKAFYSLSVFSTTL